MPRKTQQVETRMVSEYLLATYPQYPSMTKVPLGAVPNPLMEQVGYQKALGVMRPFRPECDAIVILPRYLVLIEAKVWNVVNGLAKMPLYKSLIPTTPELKQYQSLDIIMELVVGQTNTNLAAMASTAGVTIQIYNPPWLQAVVDGMNKYWTSDYQNARNQKQALREYYGVD